MLRIRRRKGLLKLVEKTSNDTPHFPYLGIGPGNPWADWGLPYQLPKKNIPRDIALQILVLYHNQPGSCKLQYALLHKVGKGFFNELAKAHNIKIVTYKPDEEIY